jgi:hypothetical protein
MAATERYRLENGVYCIDVRVMDSKQLFDGRDPAPFREKDLDEHFVHLLVMSCEEISRGSDVKIVLAAPEGQLNSQQKNDITLGIHQYFLHEARATRNDLSILFKQGRVGLILGLTFVIVCVTAAIRYVGEQTILRRAIQESLIVAGWVAMWQPINIFLYEWWPFVRKMRIYKLLSEIKIEFVSSSANG